jgi:thiamine phosphate synthase YjbQ (UPF0047 family)
MALSASELTLQLRPRSRLDVINVSERTGSLLSGHRKALYYSYHTTAGYLEQRLCARLKHDSHNLQAFVRSFQRLFPPNANYWHDDIDRRRELSDDQKKGEPRNADAHLTFIGSGLANCVTYRNDPRVPVYFIDLDGMNGQVHRLRQTTVIGYDRESLAAEALISVPVSGHPIDSVSLKNRQLGIVDQLVDMVRRFDITRGRIDLSLDREEQHAGLTVNEYETLLMRHDLVEVLRDPLRFMAERGKHMILDPRAIPAKAKGYAKYDFVQIFNEFLDAMGLNESLLERVLHKFLAFPAARFLRVKRGVSLLISDRTGSGYGSIVEGTYQSPILVQWRKAPSRTRRLRVTLVRFD